MPELGPTDLLILARLTGRPADQIADSPALAALGEMLIRDGLTGLYSRRYLNLRLHLELDRAGPDQPVSVWVMDLNGFKKVNDTLGHAAGDRLLVETARVLRDAVPAAGCAARYGGDEFVVVLPGWTTDAAADLARRTGERLGRIRSAAMPGRGPARLGASVGIATWPADASDYAGLVAAADQAMYYAKFHRRGGVWLAASLPAGSERAMAVGAAGARSVDPPAGTVTFLCAQLEPASGTRGTDSTENTPSTPTTHSTQSTQSVAEALLAGSLHECAGFLLPWPGADHGCAAAFGRAVDAVAAAVAAFQALATAPGAQARPAPARIALHTGPAEFHDGQYEGPEVGRALQLAQAAHGGQVLLSQATCERVRDHLPEDAGLVSLGEHRFWDLASAEAVYQLTHPALPAQHPPLKSLSTLPNNLPAAAGRFIGREQELAAVHRLLADQRQVTLVGAGGCGKTRLALQAAAALLPDYPGGVWHVDLAPLAQPGLVPQALASALGVPEERGRPLLETLVEFLRPRRLLLVLDNCEHLAAACAALVQTLLGECPDLRVLATSRTTLNLAGEKVWRVPSLAIPDPHQTPPLVELGRYDSVGLFVQRAGESRIGFALTAANAAVISAICHRLDGIPLAIELAAARVRVLAVEDIAARLSDSFHLLTGGRAATLPRHRTLRAAVDWSYDLLSPPEQALWQRLSVFAGGFDLPAAEAVCWGGAGGEGEEVGVAATDVLDLLDQLAEKSLVVVDASASASATRYRLLETIRQYGAEQMAKSEAAATVRQRHLEWCLTLAEGAAPLLQGPDQGMWLNRLALEHDNLRAALRWSQGADGAEMGLRLAVALVRFWEMRGFTAEGLSWLEDLLAHAAGLAPALRGRALNAAGGMARLQGNYPAARRYWSQSLEVMRDLQDDYGVARALTNLGLLAQEQRSYAEAAALLAASLEIWRRQGHQINMAITLNNLGTIALEQGDVAAARPRFTESLALGRELGDRRHTAIVLHALGMVALREGNAAAAAESCAESLALFRELGDDLCIAEVLDAQGFMAFGRGDLTAARALHQQGLKRKGNSRRGIVDSLEHLAWVESAVGHALNSARLLAAAAAHRQALGTDLPPYLQAHHDQAAAAARASLGERAFAAAWAAGETLAVEQAVAIALGEGDPSPRLTLR